MCKDKLQVVALQTDLTSVQCKRCKNTSIILGSGFCELIKDVKVAFIEDLSYDTVLFQQVVCNVGSDGFALPIELDFKVFSMSRRIVVSERFGTSKTF